MGGPYRLAVLPGEGIGPEVTSAALRTLEHAAAATGVEIRAERADFGIPAFERHGSYLPEATKKLCADADGILLGAVEKGGLLELRSGLDVFANLRPVRCVDALLDASSLKADRVRGTDILFVRELTSGIHFGPSGRGQDEKGAYGYHTMLYHDAQVRRIARVGLEQASRRRGRLCVAHKENALPHIPWCELVGDEARGFPDVEIESLLVDNLAMQLVMEPTRFDVILSGNLMGDWLSSIGGALVGSIGLLASASLDGRGKGLYEPIHGTAPEIAGKGIANPLGAVGSVVLMLRQWGEESLATRLEQALLQVLEDGHRTPDLLTASGLRSLSTEEMADRVIEAFDRATGGPHD